MCQLHLKLFAQKIVENVMADLYMHKLQSVERIDLASFDREIIRPNVVAADLGHNHKSDDFNSFLMHLFF
jgi:hypothetical protein